MVGDAPYVVCSSWSDECILFTIRNVVIINTVGIRLLDHADFNISLDQCGVDIVEQQDLESSSNISFQLIDLFTPSISETIST